MTFPTDLTMTKESVKIVLEAEYKLLCLCDSFKAAFNKHAEDSGTTTIPSKLALIYSTSRTVIVTEFYFNFKTSIFGEVIPSPISNSRPLPHLYFITTPLLPCGRIDPKIEKFTGNGDIGLASDHMTKAIHAFTHFSAVYTQNNLLICNLQGMHIPNSCTSSGPTGGISLINFKLVGALDMQGTMCLTDPQSHR